MISPSSSPVYLVWNGELHIDAAPAQVWPYILAYPAWQNYEINDRVSGTPDTEGEVVLLKKVEAGFDFPPYYARTIKLEADRRIIWKTYAHESSDMGFVGYVEFVLTPDEHGTRFNYNIIYEFELAGRSEADLDRFRAEQFASSQKVFDSIFPKLKRLVERDGTARG